MAATKLDGAGAAKMKTLEEALGGLQRVHGIVEQMALAMKQGKSASIFGLQIRRAATPLVGQLKGQFGLISDQVSAMILVATRGGTEQAKLRSMRESVALLRQAIEIAQNRVKEQHAVDIELTPE